MTRGPSPPTLHPPPEGFLHVVIQMDAGRCNLPPEPSRPTLCSTWSTPVRSSLKTPLGHSAAKPLACQAEPYSIKLRSQAPLSCAKRRCSTAVPSLILRLPVRMELALI